MNEFAAQLNRVVRYARRPIDSASPGCPHCGSDATRTHRKITPKHECLECFEEFTDDEARQGEAERLRPGQETMDGDTHEPDEQPDLVEFVLNKVGGGAATDDINYGTGFITPDGRGVQMGPPSQRYDDHRSAIPSHDAMSRWGWDGDVLRHYTDGTRTPALYELMKRAGLVRLHSDSSGTMTVGLGAKPTKAQTEALMKHALEKRHSYVVIAPRDGDEIELEGQKVWDLDKHLKRASRSLPEHG